RRTELAEQFNERVRQRETGAHEQRRAGARGRRDQPDEVAHRSALGEPDGDREWPVPEHIALDAQVADIPRQPELRLPRLLVAHGREAHPIEFEELEPDLRALDDARHRLADALEGE